MKIKDFSDDKKKIINKDGIFVVKACAGSGKTSLVAAKIASLLENWEDSNRGIAAISFTNVAWQEIGYKLETDFGMSSRLTYPHFLGTIDSFLNRYIFLPFGHLILKCEKRPEILTNWEPSIQGNIECIKKNCKLSEISYDINGNLICYNDSSHFRNCSLDHNNCEKLKRKLSEMGYVTQTDANYFSMRLLDEYSDIAKAVVSKYSLFLIDEAQDTSEVQMKIFEVLLDNGLSELMIIGNPNQAIYEWRTANPEVFLNKEKEWETLPLYENWRSSKEICAFTDKLVSKDYNSVSCNQEVIDFDFKPEIWGYNVKVPLNLEANRLINKFLETCKDNNIQISKEKVAILVRGKNILNEIRNQENIIGKEPWKEQMQKTGRRNRLVKDKNNVHYRNIAKSKYLFDKKEYKDSFRLLERSICAIRKEKEYVSNNELNELIDQIGFKNWRVKLFDLLTSLPKTDLSLKEWVDATNKIIKNDNFFRINNFEIKIKKNTHDLKYSEVKFEQIFGNKEVETENYTLGTIHSVKGEHLKQF